MKLYRIHRIIKFDHLLLIPIMALAFYIAFIPHLDYPYPVHIDEWFHLAYSKAMLNAGSTAFVDPFFGQSTINLASNLETGFHLFWGVFQRISGLPWTIIFRYFPGIVFMLTVLSVYILARREGFGWEAAFFTSLIPTTVGILGPAFLVPVAMGLVFVPLTMFLAFNFKNTWSYLMIFIFTGFLLLIHAPSAIFLVIILAPFILLNLKSNLKHSLGLGLALSIPFLIPFPWIFDLLVPTAKALLGPQAPPTHVDLPRIIAVFGYLPILLCLLGTFVLALKGNKKSYGLILGLLAMLLMLAVFFTFHYGVSILYERGLTFTMLMMSLLAGAGLMQIKKIKLPDNISRRLKVPWLKNNIGAVLCLALVALTLVIAIPAHQNTPYYLMIDKQDYAAFVWIRDNVGDEYQKAILDPWKATAFVAITGKRVFSKIHAYPEPSDEEAYAFLGDGCRDSDFLARNDISIVYSRSPCQNPDLTEVREHVYLFKRAE